MANKTILLMAVVLFSVGCNNTENHRVQPNTNTTAGETPTGDCGADCISFQPANASLKLTRQALDAQVKLADAGDKVAAFSVYRHYAFTTDNEAAARKWLEKAASLGHPSAMFNLGYHLLNDDGGDKEAGLELIRKAANLGNDVAARHLHRLGHVL